MNVVRPHKIILDFTPRRQKRLRFNENLARLFAGMLRWR
jgi:hypothetical protein